MDFVGDRIIKEDKIRLTSNSNYYYEINIPQKIRDKQIPPVKRFGRDK